MKKKPRVPKFRRATPAVRREALVEATLRCLKKYGHDGVSVRRIAGWYNLGLTPEEIAAKIEHLSLAQIHAALTYYHANRDEIDSDMAAEDAAIEEIFPTPAGTGRRSGCTLGNFGRFPI